MNNGKPISVNMKHMVYDPVKTIDNNLGYLDGKFYTRQIMATKWFKLNKLTITEKRVKALYKLLELNGFDNRFTIYGEILKRYKTEKVFFEDNKFIVNDPNSFLGAEFSYWGNQFYFRPNNKCDWVQMKKMTISPKRIKALYKLIKEQEK